MHCWPFAKVRRSGCRRAPRWPGRCPARAPQVVAHQHQVESPIGQGPGAGLDIGLDDLGHRAQRTDGLGITVYAGHPPALGGQPAQVAPTAAGEVEAAAALWGGDPAANGRERSSDAGPDVVGQPGHDAWAQVGERHQSKTAPSAAKTSPISRGRHPANRRFANRQVDQGGEDAQRHRQPPHHVVAAGRVVEAYQPERQGSCPPGGSGKQKPPNIDICAGPKICAITALVGGTVDSHRKPITAENR